MAVSRKTISVMNRSDLEEKCIEISEENQLLKKHAKAQEEKIKKLATKLLKLSSDERRELSLKRKLDKKAAAMGGLPTSRTDQLEDLVYELQDKIRELEKQKANLMGRVTILRQQLESKGKRHTPYDRVQSKVNSGLSKGSQKSYSTEDISTMKRQSISTQVSPGPIRYGHSLLEDARRDKQELEELVLRLKREVGVLQEEVEHRKEQTRITELKHEEELLQLKQQMQLIKNTSQRANLEEDVEKIRLQRELRLKTVSIHSMETQYSTLEKNFTVMKSSRDELMDEVRLLNTQLTQERTRSSDLTNQLHTVKIDTQNITELQGVVSDLKVERDILKLSNDRLMKSALNAAPTHHSVLPSSLTHAPPPPLPPSSLQLTSKLMEERIKEAETRLTREADNHRNTVLQLQAELKSKDDAIKELGEVRSQLVELEGEHQSIKTRLSQYCQGSIDWTLIKEALTQYKLKPTGMVKLEENVQVVTTPTMTAPSMCTGQCREEVQELELALAETTNELDKSNRLLSLQNTITQDCKREIEALREEIRHLKEDYDKKLEEQLQLVAIKATRIKKLESQLKNIAYSPRRSNIEKSSVSLSDDNNDSIVDLSPGQNLIQLYLDCLSLSPESVRCFQSSSPTAPPPSLFMCLLLGGYQTQVTPVECSYNPVFQFTANYVMNMDEEFTQQLNTGSLSMELYQAFGEQYEILGRAVLSLKPLLSPACGHGDVYQERITFQGAGKLSSVTQAASLKYWMKLKLPLTTPIHAHSPKHGHLPPPPAKVSAHSDNEPAVKPSTTSPFIQDHTQRDLSPKTKVQRSPPSSSRSPVQSRTIRTSPPPSPPPSLTPSTIRSKSPSLETEESESSQSEDEGGVTNIVGIKSRYDNVVNTQKVGIKNKTETRNEPGTRSKNESRNAAKIRNETETRNEPETRNKTESRNENETRNEKKDRKEDIGNKSDVAGSEIAANNSDLFGSLTSTEELSEIQEDLEELTGVTTEEDTLFEETLKTNESVTMIQSQPSVKLLEESEEEDSTIGGGSLDLSEDEEKHSSPLPPPSPTQDPTSHGPSSDSVSNIEPSNGRQGTVIEEQPMEDDDFEVRFSLTILSFTLEETCSSLDQIIPHIVEIFIEYQLLDLDGGELETPTSLPLPQPGKTAVFNFTKDIVISKKRNPTTAALLLAMLNTETPIERRIPFTVVSDPQENDSEEECQEVGVAELDLIEAINATDASHTVEDIDVYAAVDDGEVIGYLTVSMDGLDQLRKLITAK